MVKKYISDREFPGSDLIRYPRKILTNSIFIQASPERIWPWLIQLGSGRAGWYSYDKIDNGGVPSATKIINEFQHINVGDILPAVPNTKDAFIVQEVVPLKTLVLVVPILSACEETNNFKRMNSPLRVSWSLNLETSDNKTTNLISYGRISYEWLAYSAPNSNGNKLFIERIYGLFSKMPWFLIQPFALTGHYMMESRMLKGIKRRVENE
jgi:hypothetical protein